MKTFVACLALLGLPLAIGPIFADDEEEGALAPGEPAPLLKAEGWLNGGAPGGATVKGKVWVIDFFAFW